MKSYYQKLALKQKATLISLTSEKVVFLSTCILPVTRSDRIKDLKKEEEEKGLYFACYFHSVSVELQLALEANHNEVKIMRMGLRMLMGKRSRPWTNTTRTSGEFGIRHRVIIAFACF